MEDSFVYLGLSDVVAGLESVYQILVGLEFALVIEINFKYFLDYYLQEVALALCA